MNLSLLTIVVGSTSCGKEDVRVYRAPKDQPPAMQARSAEPQMPIRPPRIDFVLPEGWSEKPVTSQMQAANFAILNDGGAGAQVTVVPLPDVMSNELQVVNLWRESLGLEPVDEANLPSLKQNAEIAGQSGVIYDLLGEEGRDGERILVGIVTLDGLSWFFKMTGEDEFVGQQTSNFRSFLASVEINEAPVATAAPMMSGGGGPSLPHWEVPSGWTPEAPGQMLLAVFAVPGTGGGQARVTVSSFGGNMMGGLQANVNRWRGQIGLGPVDAGELGSVASTFEWSEGEGTLVDLKGAGNQAQQLVVAVLVHDDRTWYFKFLGDAETVGKAKAQFLGFVHSVDFHHG